MTVRVMITICVTFEFVMSTLTLAKPAEPFCIVTIAVVAFVVMVPSASTTLLICGLIDVTL